MTKFIPISPTSLSTFQTCPRMFEAKYITKEVKFVDTPATLYGNRMHKALEERIRDGKQLPEEFESLEWIGEMFDGLKTGAEVFVERSLAIDRDFKPCSYRAWDTKYVNGKDDVTIIKGSIAITFDWKSGKVKTDTQQLKLLALMTFAHHPQVQEVRSGLVFLQNKTIVPFVTKREDFDIGELLSEFKRYEAAQESGKYLPTPKGLCRQYCDVISCSHNGRS